MSLSARSLTGILTPRTSLWARIRSDLARNRQIYLILLPVLAYFAIFYYVPLYGAQIAFRDYSPGKGILGSPWVGLQYFKQFFDSYYFWRLLRNTLLINLYDIVFGFPAPVILALLLNEIRLRSFKRTAQTITYLPHFISMVVVCGMIIDFTASKGLVNSLLGYVGIKPIQFMTEPGLFRPVFVSSGIWQEFGWGSIVYLAALSGIDPELYDAARIDGAGRWKQTLYVTIPCLLPVISIMLILRCGNIMNVGVEKILLLYNPTTYEAADVISSFIYRKGLIENSYSYASAVGLFNSVINFVVLLAVNQASKRMSEDTGLF